MYTSDLNLIFHSTYEWRIEFKKQRTDFVLYTNRPLNDVFKDESMYATCIRCTHINTFIKMINLSGRRLGSCGLCNC